MKQELIELFGQAQEATPGTGKADDVMIAASEGEYVIPADVVALIGEGNNKAGAEILDKIVNYLRQDAQGS